MPMIKTALPASVLLLLACTSCGSIPTQEFEFDALDAAENPRPCLVVIGNDWIGAANRQQWVNVEGDDVLTLTIEFVSTEIEVTMAPLLVSGGKPVAVPKSRKEAMDSSGFKDQQRRLVTTDPRRQLFILSRRTAGS